MTHQTPREHINKDYGWFFYTSEDGSKSFNLIGKSFEKLSLPAQEQYSRILGSKPIFDNWKISITTPKKLSKINLKEEAS